MKRKNIGKYITVMLLSGSLFYGINNINSIANAEDVGGQVVLGGLFNKANGYYTTVSAGIGNRTEGRYTSVSGGSENVASNITSSISGGTRNAASGESSSISGGTKNTASGYTSSILGGQENKATAGFSSVFSGLENTASNEFSFVSGGDKNNASGRYSYVVGGLNNKASEYLSSVLSGSFNVASGLWSTVVAGDLNSASGAGASISGGQSNIAKGNWSNIFGGQNNVTSGANSTVIAGLNNEASGEFSSINGGSMNRAHGDYSTTSGGYENSAIGNKSYASGGSEAVVQGELSTGLAGGSTGAEATNSVAIGNQSVVTVKNGTSIGYQSTTSEEGTISFGHNQGDVSGYKVEWTMENIKEEENHGANDYKWIPNVTTNTYNSSYYNRLVNIAEGKDAHDAVNMSQLTQYEAGNNISITDIGTNELGQTIKQISVTGLGELDNRVGELDTRINKVGAGAAALAGLHPLDFDSEAKLDFSASVGNYRNATATAVGLFYRPDNRTMFSLGWTMGDSRNMVNGGFSVKLGKGSKYEGISKSNMAKIIDEQANEIQELKKQIKEILVKVNLKEHK